MAKLRDSIAKDIPAIVAVLVAQAKAGDVAAARVLIERVIPAIKSLDSPVKFKLATEGSMSDQGEALIQAMAGGAITPDQGNRLLSSLAMLAKLVETDELEARIAALEQSR